VHQSLEIARESVWDAKGYPVYSGWQWYCLETAVLLDHLTGPNRWLVNTVTVTLELEPSKFIWYQFGMIFVTFTMAGPEYPEYDIVHRICCFHGSISIILIGFTNNKFIFRTVTFGFCSIFSNLDWFCLPWSNFDGFLEKTIVPKFMTLCYVIAPLRHCSTYYHSLPSLSGPEKNGMNKAKLH